MKITILCVGKIKEKFYKDALAEYEKRLSKYCKLSICEVTDEKTPDHASESVVDAILQKEAQRLFKYWDENAYHLTLEIKGKALDSVAFSSFIEKLGIDGNSHLQFVIGGSLGLHESIIQKSDFALSFSPMTFPHQLMRVILLEQIYRSFRISAGEPYHK